MNSSGQSTHPSLREESLQHEDPMLLGPWEIGVHPPGLTYRIPAISLPYGSRVWLSGDNGAGKTVFLERVLLPRLAAMGRQVFLVAQDLLLQAHVMAAVLASRGQRAPRCLDDLVMAWCAPARPNSILLLDEADRHLSPRTIHQLLELPLAFVVAVSHQGRPCTTTHCFTICRHETLVHLEIGP